MSTKWNLVFLVYMSTIFFHLSSMKEKKIEDSDIEIWRNFLVYQSEIVYEIDSALKKADCISLAWYDILIVLERSKSKSLPMSELIQETVLTKSGVSKLLDRIQAKGLVTSKKSKEDARSLVIHITDEGSLEVRKTWKIYKEMIDQFFLAPLTNSEKNILKISFIKLRAKLK